jgi:membrane protease YdiL (CAAX protease family)
MIVGFYALLGLAGLAWALGTETPLKLYDQTQSPQGALAIGLVTGFVGLFLWDWLAKNASSLRKLWQMLRTIIGPQTIGSVFLMALSSSVAEEFFFRGVMQAHLGIAATSVLFGLLHGLPGSRFGCWGIFAIVAGLVFGLLYEVSGGLLAPTAAHFTINFVNLYRLSRPNPSLFTNKT